MKQKIKNSISFLILALLLLVIFRPWFLTDTIIGGDWPFYFPQMLEDFSFPPQAWGSWRGNGFGGIDIVYALHLFENFLIALSSFLQIPWGIFAKYVWFGGFLGLSVFSSWYLTAVVFPESPRWQRALGAFLYTANTYILLVVGGGQMGYALGYATAPAILAGFITTVESQDTRGKIVKTICTGLGLGFLLMIDIRIVYMLLMIIGMYCLYGSITKQHSLRTILLNGVSIVIIAGLVNLSWLLPLVFLRQDLVGEVSSTYNSVASLSFFSFANFSNTIGLLHPNWPENIFGKVGFMKPEYLLLPMFAFSALLSISLAKRLSRKELFICFFALVGLLGAFLAKGVNEPFGPAYGWFFENIPGFVMFRDPSKWYFLTAIAYTILVPHTILYISELFKVHSFAARIRLPYLFIIICALGLLFLIRPIILGQVTGTFASQTLPSEYQQLATYLNNGNGFFRTLWVPRQTRFSFSSTDKRIVEAMPYYDASSSAEVIKELQAPDAEENLANASIRYVIVPYDSAGEIFQKDKKYNPEEYEYVVRELQKIDWLTEVKSFEKIKVFATDDYNEHFYLTQPGSVHSMERSATEYVITIRATQSGSLIFTETYHPDWIAESGSKQLSITKTRDGYMQIEIPKGDMNLHISFSQQNYYLLGFYLSLGVLILLVIITIMLQYKGFFVYLKNTF